jgi:ketosteroid isomerase-like protein
LPVMPEESATPDLVELVRGSIDSFARRDLDATMSVYGPASVWDTSPAGMGTFEGLAAIRGFFEDWISAYEEFEIDAEEILDLGNGVTFAVFNQRGRPVGSSGEVRVRSASVAVWAEGLLVRVTNYPDIDEGRAAAERLAESRA